MSTEDFDRFRQCVIDSPELQRGLREIEDWADFTRVAVREAAALGLTVDRADVDTARQSARRAWLERWIP